MPDTNLDLTRQSDGERLWIARHATGLTLDEAAGVLRDRAGGRLCRTTLCEMEWGERPVPRRLRAWCKAETRGTELERPTLLRLARRRSGLELRDAAAGIGVSHTWLLRLERRGDARVAAFWGAAGFNFD